MFCFIRILFPGGGVDLMNSQFAKTAMIFYKLAIQVCLYNCCQIKFLWMNTCSLYFILFLTKTFTNIFAWTFISEKKIFIIVWSALIKLPLRIHVHCSAVYFKTFFQMISLTCYCRFHIKHKFKIQAFSCFFSNLQEYKSVIEFQTFVLVSYI